MRQRGDSLHFDRVHLFERIIQNTRSIDNLPPQVLVVQMTDKKRFRGECIKAERRRRQRRMIFRRWDSRKLRAFECWEDERCVAGLVRGMIDNVDKVQI